MQVEQVVSKEFVGGSLKVYVDGQLVHDQPFDPRDGKAWFDEAEALDWYESDLKGQYEPAAVVAEQPVA